METKSRRVKLPTITKKQQNCSFDGYDAMSLMAETAKLRKLITKRGTLETLIPLCCTTHPVRYMKFRQTLQGFSSKTLVIRLKELQKGGILERLFPLITIHKNSSGLTLKWHASVVSKIICRGISHTERVTNARLAKMAIVMK